MNEENTPLSKEDQWEGLKTQRPRLFIEVGSSGHGVGISSLEGKREFTQGQYKDCRYLRIDPDPSVKANNTQEYSLGLEKSIVDPEILKRFEGRADEIWIKNTGSVVEKPEWYKTIFALLKPGGRVILFDNYTPDLYNEEKDKFAQFFEDIGFEFHDWPTNYINSPIENHVLVKQGKKYSTSSNQPVILESIKK